MNYALYRYWIPPSHWRQWSPLQRLVVIVVLFAVSFGLTAIPLCIWLPQHTWRGIAGYFVPILGMIFLGIVDVGAAIAGATVIASERERGSWEALLLTSLGIGRIVRTKLIARLVLCTLVVSWTLPFWLAWAYEVLMDNDRDTNAYYSADGTLPLRFTALRLGLFLFWLAVRIVGRVMPFAAFGLAVSARCGRVRTAILVTTGTIIAVCVILWVFLPTVSKGVFLRPDEPVRTAGISLLSWPLMPNSYDDYTATSLFSTHWKTDLAADCLWLMAIPALWTWLAIRWGRRRNTDYRTESELERRRHEL